MLLTIHSALLASFLQLAASQRVHWSIPEVEQDVHSMLDEFGWWQKYSGPTKTPSYGLPVPTYTPPPPKDVCSYWLEDIKHQGYAAFNANPGSYQVFRNVKDFGAVGDGITDDTAAINRAISSGGTCGPGCPSSTTSPAIVYFPAGTYLISSSVTPYYYVSLIGNPNCMPTLKANATFSGFGLIDGNPYGANGLTWGATNVFYRQVRNFVLDMRNIPANNSATGVHWPTAQATSLQNVVFDMPSDNGTLHQGVFIEEGSGGFMNDLVFNGGLYGLNVGNQQFTMRNLTFNGVVTAINQIWDWGWTYKSININNCSVGLNFSSGGSQAQSVGSITFIDSSIKDTPVGIITARNANSQPAAAGSLILENVQVSNVPIVVQGLDGSTILSGRSGLPNGQAMIQAWGQGHEYTPNGPVVFQGAIPPNNRPGILLQAGGKFYERSKPQYQNQPVSSFVSARDRGAKGDGVTDDTAALQAAVLSAAASNKILFVDHGDYKVTQTLYIPPGSQIVGEVYAVILASGSFFADMKNPKPVVQVGHAGEGGNVDWSDMIVSTQGAEAGAILVEWNLNAGGTPSGMFDVHARIGGFAGSNLSVQQCRLTPQIQAPPVNTNCIAAYLTMHVTKSASGLYMENVWLWTADHDIDDANLTQTTIYAGRGFYDESSSGKLWLVGTAVEHHTLYQYQYANTKAVFQGQIQTETAYYQPNPNATIPFPAVAALNDPTFPLSTTPYSINATAPRVNNADGWGLRILNSQDILTYGAGLYSFFNNWSTSCSAQGNNEECQSRILSIEGSSSNTPVYNLNTVGTTYQVTLNGKDVVNAADSRDGFIDTVALFRT